MGMGLGANTEAWVSGRALRVQKKKKGIQSKNVLGARRCRTLAFCGREGLGATRQKGKHEALKQNLNRCQCREKPPGRGIKTAECNDTSREVR